MSGNPVLVTVKDPAVPVVKVVLEPDVMDGAWPTVRVKDCVAFGRLPLAAVIVNGRCHRSPPPACPTGWRCRHRCR